MRIHIATGLTSLLLASCGPSDTNFVEERRYAPGEKDPSANSTADANGKVGANGATGNHDGVDSLGSDGESFENSGNSPGTGANNNNGSGGLGGSDAGGEGLAGSGSGGGMDSGGSDGSGMDGGGGSGGTPSAEEILATCASSAQVLATSEISFPSRKDCNWGTNNGGTIQLSANGNLPIKDGWIRAREEQTVSLNVPPGAILCRLELSSTNNQIHFDDFFSMRVDKYVVAASKVLSNALVKDSDGHYNWDWVRIRGNGSQGSGTQMQDLGKYCGTGDCLLPEHDTPGAFALNFSLEENGSTQNTMNAALFGKLANKTKIDITATATGDNDDDDCFHSGGQFTAKIYYVPQ